MCWKNSAELNYVFAKIGGRISDFYAAASKIPSVYTLTVESDIYLVLGMLSAFFCEGGLRTRENRPSNRRFSRRRLEDTLFFQVRR